MNASCLPLGCRAISLALAALQPCYGFSAAALAAEAPAQTGQVAAVHAAGSRSPDSLSPSALRPPAPARSAFAAPTVHFSEQPTEAEFFDAPIFSVALLAIGKTSAAENKALAKSLMAYAGRNDPDDQSVLLEFLRSFPQSAWKTALLLNLGIAWRQAGYFSRAMDAWSEAWDLSKRDGSHAGKSLADLAFGELLQINSWVGRYEKLEPLLAETKDRSLTGGATEMLAGAREGLWIMNNKPETGFMCGPCAVRQIVRALKPDANLESLNSAKACRRGFSLTHVQELAHRCGLSYQIAKKTTGIDVPAHSVVHWKLDHYGAVMKHERGKYLVQDPTFSRFYGQELWISQAALDEESDGYFLIPGGELPTGWRTVPEQEAAAVWGRGATTGKDQNAYTPQDCQTQCGEARPGMAVYGAHLMLVSLNISDEPLGYKPPVGPAVRFRVKYIQREMETRDTANYSNLGDKWTFDWLSYISDSGANNPISVYRYVSGGGRVFHTHNSGGVYFSDRDGAMLNYFNTSDPSGERYELSFPDGSKQIFKNPSATGSRRVFLSSVQDPSGNKLTINYSSPGKIDTLTDALNRSTKLYYELDQTDPTLAYRITKIEDPFHRFAYFAYDQDARLKSITDVIGMTSVYSYGQNNFINQMTTPYGVTSFVPTENNLDRSLRITDPTGAWEYIYYRDDSSGANPPVPSFEPSTDAPPNVYNTYQEYRNTFHFDKKTTALVGIANLNNAVIYHWLHDGEQDHGNAPVFASGILESIKRPLEGRVWFKYPGQNHDSFAGGITLRSPSLATRMVEDGQGGKTTQSYSIGYNAQGNITSFTDPMGRQTTLTYYDGGIDLQKISQLVNGASQTLAEFGSYDFPHRPHSFIDASRQTWNLSWNTVGQLAIVTPPGFPAGQDRKYTYNASGYLTQIQEECPACGDCPCVAKSTSLTYDGFDRVRTMTDSEGYVLTYDYDALDRVTKITHPDQTFEKYDYLRLDLVRTWDRAGHRTQITYDDAGRPVSVKDRLGRVTSFGWCGCGSIETITGPLNQLTTWVRDIQGRITNKRYPDYATTGKQITYVYEPLGGRLQSTTDAKGQVKNFTYSADDNLNGVTYTVGGAPTGTPSVFLNYDSYFNRLAYVILTRSGVTERTDFGYNSITGSQTTGAGRLASIDGPLVNDTITYGYDVLGRTTSRLINGVGESFAYDNLNRVYSHTNLLGSSWISWLNATFRPVSILYPNNQLAVFSWFDNAGDQRLKQIWNKTSAGGMISKFDYQYDVLGRITNWTQQVGGGTALAYGFEYDREDQLVRWELPGTGSAHKGFTWLYDAAGNNTSRQSEQGPVGNTMTLSRLDYNNLNQLSARTANGNLPARFRGTVNEPATVTVAGQPAALAPNPASNTGGEIFTATANLQVGVHPTTVEIRATDFGANGGNITISNFDQPVVGFGEKSYTYDDNGNCITSGSTTYEWDAEDRLIKITQPSTGNSQLVTELSYDAFGRRTKIVEKTVAGGTETVTSTKQFIWCGAQICEERDGGNNVTKRFFPEGEQISGASYYATFDHLGSVREMTDSSGAIRARYDYSMYGVRGANQILSNPIEADFGFTGHYFHAPSGLHLAWFRAYDADAQRWLSRDPLGEDEDLNPYSYARDNPIRWADPLGLYESSPILRATVPGQVSYDNSITSLENGNYLSAGLFAASMLAEQVLYALTLGRSQIAAPGVSTSQAGKGLSGLLSKCKSLKKPPKNFKLSQQEVQRIRDAFAKGLDEKFRTGGGVDELRQILLEHGFTVEEINKLMPGIIKYIKR